MIVKVITKLIAFHYCTMLCIIQSRIAYNTEFRTLLDDSQVLLLKQIQLIVFKLKKVQVPTFLLT